jgi:dolichol-phosphate mannosyltransferase
MTEQPAGEPNALVIVPTFNERESIAEAARRLFAAAEGKVHLLVVDDSSPDGTAEVVRSMAEERRDIHLLERTTKAGLGDAYVAGFRWAMERGYKAVVEMDADLSHDPAAVPELLAALEGADLVIGSRYVPGGAIQNWGGFRKGLSRLGNVYAGAWLRLGVKDLTSGFRAFRTSALESQDLGTVATHGYAFQIEMARRVQQAGGRIAEVPITFVERTAGQSKMSRRIVVEALLQVTRWGLADLLRPAARRRSS